MRPSPLLSVLLFDLPMSTDTSLPVSSSEEGETASSSPEVQAFTFDTDLDIYFSGQELSKEEIIQSLSDEAYTAWKLQFVSFRLGYAQAMVNTLTRDPKAPVPAYRSPAKPISNPNGEFASLYLPGPDLVINYPRQIGNSILSHRFVEHWSASVSYINPKNFSMDYYQWLPEDPFSGYDIGYDRCETYRDEQFSVFPVVLPTKYRPFIERYLNESQQKMTPDLFMQFYLFARLGATCSESGYVATIAERENITINGREFLYVVIHNNAGYPNTPHTTCEYPVHYCSDYTPFMQDSKTGLWFSADSYRVLVDLLSKVQFNADLTQAAHKTELVTDHHFFLEPQDEWARYQSADFGFSFSYPTSVYREFIFSQTKLFDKTIISDEESLESRLSALDIQFLDGSVLAYSTMPFRAKTVHDGGIQLFLVVNHDIYSVMELFATIFENAVSISSHKTKSGVGIVEYPSLFGHEYRTTIVPLKKQTPSSLIIISIPDRGTRIQEHLISSITTDT